LFFCGNGLVPGILALAGKKTQCFL
jgi:hypothetical protein